MKVRLCILFLFIISFSECWMQIADCAEIRNPKSGMSRNEAIKLFTDANEKYLQASKLIAARNNPEAEQKLKDAALQYEMILLNGYKNGQIYYNLGNTYYRQGELGRTILNYRRAQRLMPRNADLDTNLKLVKNSTEDKEISSEVPVVIRRIFFWFFLMSQNELIILAVSLYVVLMMMLFFIIILKYSWLKRIMIGFSAGLFIAVLSLGVKGYAEHAVSHGVIITSKCQVRYGPGEEYEPKFEIHDGAECVIEGEKDNWYRVYVYVGVKQDTGAKTSGEEKVGKEIRRGWLPKKNVDMI